MSTQALPILCSGNKGKEANYLQNLRSTLR